MDTADSTIQDTEEAVLRVKSSSNPQSVASALAHAIYEKRHVTLRAIGAGSVNQAIKACAIARGYVAGRGLDLLIKPGFTTVTLSNKETGEPEDVSAIVLYVVVA